jgi:hypothetical protein
VLIGGGTYYFKKIYIDKEDDKSLRKKYMDKCEEEEFTKVPYHYSKQ